jgi:hypothetical protein
VAGKHGSGLRLYFCSPHYFTREGVCGGGGSGLGCDWVSWKHSMIASSIHSFHSESCTATPVTVVVALAGATTSPASSVTVRGCSMMAIDTFTDFPSFGMFEGTRVPGISSLW